MPYVQEQFSALLPAFPENHLVYRTGVPRQITQDFRWVNDIEYVDAQGNVHTLSVLQCLETKPGPGGQQTTTRFKWITNLNLKAACIVEIANQGGRLRWKIENEGFNVQKNGGMHWNTPIAVTRSRQKFSTSCSNWPIPWPS